MIHLTREHLDQGAAKLPRSPEKTGVLEMIVVRTGEGTRATPEEVDLSKSSGVVGDHWSRGMYASKPEMQVSLMNSHVLDLVSGGRDRWPLAGDNLIVDLDLSQANLPAGTRLTVGESVIEISTKAHRGCAQFSARYGEDAREFVNSGEGPQLRWRGVYASVVEPGTVRVGDPIVRL